MTRLALTLIASAWAACLFAAPPDVEVPAKVTGDPGAFLVITAKTDAKGARFYAVDPGLNLFPAGLLTDPKSTVATGPKGTYRVLVYAGNADGASAPKVVLVEIGGGIPVVPPVKPVDPPVIAPPTGLFYFLIVRADGPASPAFTKTMGDAAWDTLRAAGHKAKDKTATEAAKLGMSPPAGTRLPTVLILREDADGSEVVGTAPLPGDAAGILELPKKVSK